MARYITAERIKAAVDRLRQSRASGGMVNFLILKRAVTLSGGTPVSLSMKDKSLQQAITELAWWPEESTSKDQRPFINVFGTLRVKNHGRCSKKWRSTGPSDTLKNGAWSPIVEVSEGEKSKAANLRENYIEGLGELVVLKDGTRPLPRRSDAAVWYFRGQDVSGIVGKSTDDAEIEKKLSDAFVRALGLTAEDLEIVFAKEGDNAA